MPRADHDRQRRPPDGFRVRDTERFADLLRQAIAILPPPLRRPAAAASHVIDAVPAVPPPGEDPALAEFVTTPGGRPRLTVYRRAVELRATSRDELSEVLAFAVGTAVARRLDLGDVLDDWWEEDR